ncbi:MAG: asparagine synthase-related protein [Anaerolineae bacterium]|nr:asparagine synthase-related protein [Anaerolineae bacterium]
MKTNLVDSIGDFSIFGFTKNPDLFLRHTLPSRLGITPRTIDFGTAGRFFFYTTWGDVAETDESIVLKLGLLHSAQRTPISSQQLLDQELIDPRSVNADALRGSALVACFSKTSPVFSVYKTVMSMPQLYFSKLDDGVLCTDGPRPHLALLDRVAINEEAVVQHFLFRFVLGRHTFFEGINRLLPGEIFLWNDGSVDTHFLRGYHPDPGCISFNRASADTIGKLYEEIRSVMGAYISDVKETSCGFGNMISGGVDSTVIQLAMNDHIRQPEQRKTFSYVMQTPRFEFEVEYAREVVQRLQTSHTFVSVKPKEYPELLAETIETIAGPTPNEAYACKLALAKFIGKNCANIRFFFPANGADSSHGTSMVRKIAILEAVRPIPGASSSLTLIANLINPIAPRKAHGLRSAADTLPELDNPDSYKTPVNMVSVYSDIETARRCFGDEALKRAFEYRRYLEALYLDSDHPMEKTLMVGMVTDAYECGVITNLIHLAHRGEQIYPFMDEDVVRIGLAFDPKIRFLKGWRVKPLLKGILEQRSLLSIAEKPKGPSVFSEDLHDWMRSGPLRDMVQAIERPGFLSKADFEKLLEVPSWDPLDEPNWFLWNLLTFDIFQKRVVKA